MVWTELPRRLLGEECWIVPALPEIEAWWQESFVVW
jgi:hypothetical protein